MEAFRVSDEMTQIILGSYDGAAGQNNGQMSGIAFARSAIQSNNASVPFIVGYIKGLNRIAQIYIDLLPKYCRTPRSLPVLRPNGKREYVVINKTGSLYMNYDPNSLQVKVEVGVNFDMQKEIALQTIVSLSQSMPTFAQFFSQKGLQTLLDNIEIRGIDDLKEKANEYEQELAQQQASQQKMQMQQAAMEMQKVQKELQSPTAEQLGMMAVQEKAKTDAASIAIKEQEAETKFLEVMSKIQNADVENQLKIAEIQAENTRSLIDAQTKAEKHHEGL
jgi:hypothetical protein